MKKFLAILTASLLLASTIISLVLAEDAAYTIGICQLVQHSALDSAAQGFKDGLSELLGDEVAFNEQNASGDSATCIPIINAFIAEEVDMILANSTPALQAAFAGTGEIPILGTAVSDYASALDMDEWHGVTGLNVSGTSDLSPLDGHAQLLQELYPDAKEVGLLYCSSEANSVYQIQVITQHLTDMGYHCTEYAFADSNDVFSVTQSACMNSDVLYTPTDNTVASCAEVIRNVVEMEHMAIIGGDEGICSDCGVATICIDYYALGNATAKMAYEVLVNGADVSEMPIEFSPTWTKVYNPEMCELLGIVVPDDYEAIA